MNYFSLALGAFALGYGLYSIYARLKHPEKFGKLEAMKQQFGPRAGSLIHVISYTVVPILFGLSMLLAGFNGVAPMAQ
ncbi:MAG: hypothetical protein EOO38_26225 [Cytophagaceae bacterium]|nr:MAG: hypothetical protein EOO38_26225 [Cytophagaceae bacterium]